MSSFGLYAIAAVMVLAIAADAGAAAIEHLGQPCRSKNVLSGCIVIDRADGRERFAVANMSEYTHTEMIYIDFEKETGKVYTAEAGQGSWGLMEIPGDRLLIPTYHEGWYLIFDLKKMEFIKHIRFEGEGYIWTATIGGDGRAYGGSYPGGKLAALDLNTYKIEDMGAPAPPNTYLRNVYAMPDGRVLCWFGMITPTILIFDPVTKKFDPLPASMAGISAGVTWNGYFLSGAIAFDGKTLESVTPPFPAPPADKGAWSVDGELTKSGTLFLRQGNAIWRYSKGDKDLTLFADVDLRGGRLFDITKKGWIIGVRGQDYFIIKLGDTKIELKAIPVETGPRPTHFLKLDEKGRLWGGAGFGQTLFWLDPKTKKYFNTRTVCDAGGEVYDATFFDNKVYAVAYSGGDIIQYDPEQPWDQWNNVNPKTIASITAQGYIRPEGGVVLGPDNKLYSGWQARYGTYGGAVAITDPLTGKTELIENPLGEQPIKGVALDGTSIFVGTGLGANGLPRKENDQPKFGMIDMATRKVVFEQKFDASVDVGIGGYDAKTKLVVVLVGRKMKLFDPARKRFQADLPVEVPDRTAYQNETPGDGKFYYGSDKNLMALDLKSARAEIIVEAPSRIRQIAIAKDGTIYFACGVDVYQVKR